jgi:hypothetical protein
MGRESGLVGDWAAQVLSTDVSLLI